MNLTLPLLIAAASLGQSQEADYSRLRSLALAMDKPLIVFVSCTPRPVPGAISVRWDQFPAPKAGVIVGVPHQGSLHWQEVLPTDAGLMAIQGSEEKVRRTLRGEVRLVPPPFDRPRPTADDDPEAMGPWLSKTEQTAILRKIPRGVPVGPGLKFYRLPQKFQSLYTMNGGQPHRDILPVSGEEAPWHVSGGMHWGEKGTDWNNVTGLDLPGPIKVWEEWTDVGAFGPVPKVRWAFPEGTLAYDVLLNRDGKVFEVRVHEKMQGGWDDGATYRPTIREFRTVEPKGWTWGFPFAGISARATVHHVGKVDAENFAVSGKVVVDDEGFVPAFFAGAGARCNTCHSQTGQRTGYGQARRGDDGRFSFHVFTEAGGVDARWPIERK